MAQNKALGFKYSKLPYRYISHYKNGAWSKGELTENATLQISEAAPALHYGQQCFEGLKAYPTKNGDIQLFRITENAKRLNASARRLLMAEVPEAMFVEAIKTVVKKNAAHMPAYGTKATLYIRPLLIGVGNMIGVAPATEFLFTVFVMPVGAYYGDGLKPAKLKISREYDRAAPYGTGAVKVGGNYAASLAPGAQAKIEGYADALYLDAKTQTLIEEAGAANFFGVIAENNIIKTPKSPSILPSITKYSLLHLAEKKLGMKAIEGDILLEELNTFSEVATCGTAAVITPISAIHDGDTHYRFCEDVGPVTKQLYDFLTGIQFGDIEDRDGWITKI